MRRNMAASLIEHGVIRTTAPKAKQLRRFVERLITAAKQGTLHARRQVIAALGDRDTFDDEGEPLEQTVIQKLFNEIAPRYADRPGGYTRIIRLAERRIGDAGEQVLLQLVEEAPAAPAEEPAKTSRRRRRAAKRHAAASEAAPEDQAVEEEAADEEPAGQGAAEEAPAEGEDAGAEEKPD